ncbi:unnamed protein product [Ectocarpus sp. CCAP 1310/34]|nr:unnamed protein product [Ectocarpus sp. CCAP 1310/34]
MMKRPASPRRDYLMRCAERQLLPVPVINRALRIDPQTAMADPMTGDAREVHTTGGKTGEAEETNIGDSGLDGPASETLLGVLLERAGTISKLDLSGNRIGPKGASGLSRLIAHKREFVWLARVFFTLTLSMSDSCECALRSLKLDGNKAGDRAVMTVLKALARYQPPVSHLGLSDNGLTLKVMQNNKTLTNVNLTANQVRWEGAVALSEALVANTTIRNLVLRDNPIGTAAGLQMSIALAEKHGDPCLVDIKKTSGKKSGAQLDSTGASKGAPQPPENVPPPLPPPTRPDEHLFWLDLTVDRKWDLRLNRPFDRAVGREVLRTFNFSTGGSLAGILRVSGGAPRQVTFRRREKLQPASGDATRTGLSSGRGRKVCLRLSQLV